VERNQAPKLMPVILATQESDMEGSQFESNLGKNLVKLQLNNKKLGLVAPLIQLHEKYKQEDSSPGLPRYKSETLFEKY
jgi:hypothetical protein